jgi:oxygen-independent coproporphyrinogen-3 oxidase
VPSFKKHQRKIGEAFLPDSRERLRQVSAIAEALVQAGYRQIGMDHFALPNDQMAQMHRAGTLRRNFQGYTTDASDTLIGFGASAIGKLAQGFVQNEPTIPGYCDRIRGGELATARGYALTADDRLRADIIERLMCDMKVDLTAVCDRHGAKSETLLRSASRLRALADDGIVELDGSLIRIADDAHYLVRSVASTFDSYLATKPRSHSRAV